jgi:Ca2+-binding RTX toxin-like protein
LTRRARRLTLVGLATAVAVLAAAPQAFAVSQVGMGGGTLTIASPAGSENNNVTIVQNGGTFAITDTQGTTAFAPCVQSSSTTTTCPLVPPVDPNQAQIRAYRAILGDGNDTLVNNSPLGTDNTDPFGLNNGVQGGRGDDKLTGGPANETFYGQQGDDTLNGGGGNDDLYDGETPDASANFEEDPNGNDTLIGGTGRDTAHYEGRVDRLQVLLDNLPNDGDTAASEHDNVQTENVISGRGSDLLVGDAGPNHLIGNVGDDTIRGGAGGDQLDGGIGNDFLVGDTGRDRLVGGDDDDVLRATFDNSPDKLDCGDSDGDQALADARDGVDDDCERSGALLDSESVKLHKSKTGQFSIKPRVKCAPEEAGGCKGVLKLISNGERLGSGKFTIDAGKSAAGTVVLARSSAADIKRARSLSITAEVSTKEPAGKTFRRAALQIRR